MAVLRVLMVMEVMVAQVLVGLALEAVAAEVTVEAPPVRLELVVLQGQGVITH